MGLGPERECTHDFSNPCHTPQVTSTRVSVNNDSTFHEERSSKVASHPHPPFLDIPNSGLPMRDIIKKTQGFSMLFIRHRKKIQKINQMPSLFARSMGRIPSYAWHSLAASVPIHGTQSTISMDFRKDHWGNVSFVFCFFCNLLIITITANTKNKNKFHRLFQSIP